MTANEGHQHPTGVPAQRNVVLGTADIRHGIYDPAFEHQWPDGLPSRYFEARLKSSTKSSAVRQRLEPEGDHLITGEDISKQPLTIKSSRTGIDLLRDLWIADDAYCYIVDREGEREHLRRIVVVRPYVRHTPKKCEEVLILEQDDNAWTRAIAESHNTAEPRVPHGVLFGSGEKAADVENRLPNRLAKICRQMSRDGHTYTAWYVCGKESPCPEMTGDMKTKLMQAVVNEMFTIAATSKYWSTGADV